MKAFLPILIVISSLSIAQAQITTPNDEKPRFDLTLNRLSKTVYHKDLGSNVLNLELNLGMQLKKNRALYLGVGRNTRFHKYMRMGMMQTIVDRNRFSLGVGVGLSLNSYDFSLLSQGTSNQIQFELPLQAEYRITDRWSAVAGVRSSFTLASKNQNFNFDQSTSGINHQVNFGIKYRFKNNR